MKGVTAGALLTTLLIPSAAHACEPILPLVQVFGGPSLFMRSLTWLAIAVVVKCVLFGFLERRRAWPWRFGAMAAANVVSTVFGVLAAFTFIAPALWFIALPVVGVASAPAARRVLSHQRRPATPGAVGTLAAAFPVGMLATYFLWVIAQSTLSVDRAATYWLLKLTFVTLGVAISIALTTLWEDWIVSKMTGDARISDAVVRANLGTFLLVTLAAAVQMLPQRLAHRGFLVLQHGLRALVAHLA